MYSNVLAEVQHKSDFQFTKDTPCLDLAGELWGVYCENFGENWPHQNGIALYVWIYRMFIVLTALSLLQALKAVDMTAKHLKDVKAQGKHDKNIISVKSMYRCWWHDSYIPKSTCPIIPQCTIQNRNVHNWAIIGSDKDLLPIGHQKDWVKIGSANGLLPDGTKPVPKPMLTYHQ